MNYNCPVCKAEMAHNIGDQVHPGNSAYGLTIFCPNRNCSAAEVSGHGPNIKLAFEVVLQKFSRSAKSITN